MANPAVVPVKSSTSTEVFRVPVRGTINGATVDPTIYTVKAAAFLYDPPDATKRAPIAGDYVAQTWETFTDPTGGKRYWAAVIMGPAATLNPSGPPSGTAQYTYQLWLEIDAGSEVVRRPSGLFIVTP